MCDPEQTGAHVAAPAGLDFRAVDLWIPKGAILSHPVFGNLHSDRKVIYLLSLVSLGSYNRSTITWDFHKVLSACFSQFWKLGSPRSSFWQIQWGSPSGVLVVIFSLCPHIKSEKKRGGGNEGGGERKEEWRRRRRREAVSTSILRALIPCIKAPLPSTMALRTRLHFGG